MKYMLHLSVSVNFCQSLTDRHWQFLILLKKMNVIYKSDNDIVILLYLSKVLIIIEYVQIHKSKMQHCVGGTEFNKFRNFMYEKEQQTHLLYLNERRL